jgi:hypothetical protein
MVVGFTTTCAISRPFNKGRYQILLPTENGNWYLLFSKNVA